MRIDQALEQWTDHLLLMQGRSKNTVTGYMSDMRSMTKNITLVEEFTLNHVREHLGTIQHLAAPTRARQVATAKAFSKFCVSRGWSEGGQMHRLTTPRIPKQVVNHYTVEEALALMNGMRDHAIPSVGAVRDWAIMELLYGQGLRVSEAVGLDLADVDPAQMTIKINGKGNKDRMLPIGPNQLLPMVLWLALRPPVNPDEPALFIGDQGGRLDARQVRRVMAQACERVGLEDYAPHSLRHSCATHMLNGGADITAVGTMLGHENLDITTRYLHVAVSRLMTVYQGAHPRERAAA